MGSCGICPVKNSQSTARLSANSAAEPAKISRTISELPQIERTIEPRETKSDIETMITAHQPSFNPGRKRSAQKLTAGRENHKNTKKNTKTTNIFWDLGLYFPPVL